MNPMNVLRMAKMMQCRLKRILLVGCEPATLSDEEGSMGLSSAVKAAVHEAVKVAKNLVEKTLDEGLRTQSAETCKTKELRGGYPSRAARDAPLRSFSENRRWLTGVSGISHRPTDCTRAKDAALSLLASSDFRLFRAVSRARGATRLVSWVPALCQ